MKGVLRFVSMILLAVSASGCGRSIELSLASQLQGIQQSFEAARTKDEFLKVAARYQEVIDAGVVSGAIYFNQGNAYMRSDERGRVIACYRLAKRYLPRNPYLDANLRFASAGTRSLPTTLADRLIFWQDWFAFPEKFQMMVVLGAVALLLGIGGLVFKRRSALLNRSGLAVASVALMFMVSGIYDWYRCDGIRHGVVVAKQSVVRKGDAETYEPAFTQPLTDGDEFVVLDSRGSWLLIRVADEQEGWIKQSDAKIY